MLRVITGFHTIVYSEDAEATRVFFRDVLSWHHIDAHDGWLIFRTPPSELGVHPAVGDGGEVWAGVPRHEVSLMCDDLQAALSELRAKGVRVLREPQDQGWGLAAAIEVPAAGEMMLYQPRYQPPFDTAR
jgi:catechol 2,3-dioxygenase-like lactoylglutathione lyase family enzyme